MIDLRTLEVFYWVVKLGGFGRAAEKLHTTQPAGSGRIAQREQSFSIRLLDRSQRGGGGGHGRGDGRVIGRAGRREQGRRISLKWRPM